MSVGQQRPQEALQVRVVAPPSFRETLTDVLTALQNALPEAELHAATLDPTAALSDQTPGTKLDLLVVAGSIAEDRASLDRLLQERSSTAVVVLTERSESEGDDFDPDAPLRLSLSDLRSGLARALLLREITRNEVQHALARRGAFEQIIARISSSFIQSPPPLLDHALLEGLQAIGEFARVDRSFIFLASPHTKRPTLTHEWMVQGLPSAKPFPEAEQLDADSWVVQRLQSGEPLLIPDVRTLPPEAAVVRTLDPDRQACALALFPLRIGKSVIGVLGFATVRQPKEWSSEERFLLALASSVFVTAVQRARVETALRDSQARFETLIESLGDGTIFCDRDDRIIHVNTRMAQLLGYDAHELVGQVAYECIVAPAESQTLRGRTQRRLSGISEQYEIRLRRRDGGLFWAEINATPIYDSSGAIVGTLGVVADITERRCAAEALRESEQRFRNLIETTNDMIWRVDRQGRWQFVSQAVERIYGYTREEMIGRPFFEFVEPRALERDIEVFHRILQGSPVVQYETVHRRKDGSPVYLSFNAIPLTDGTGAVIGTTGTANDITQRKEAEQILQRSEARMRQYFETSLLGIAVIRPDKSWVEMNDKFCEMVGYRRDELQNLTWTDLTHPDDVASDLNLFQRVLSGHIDSYSIEKRLIRKDGSIIYVRFSVTGVRDDHREVEHFVGFVQDMTENHRVTEALRHQKEYLRQVVDTNPNLIFAKDKEGRFTLVNRAMAELYGTRVEDILGKHNHELNPNHDEVEQFLRDDLEVIASGQSKVIPEGKFVDPHTGEERWFQTIKTPLVGEDGVSPQVLAVATDITARKRAEQEAIALQRQLMQSQKMEAIGQLAAGVAHDLNNSLAAVVGHLQLMKLAAQLDANTKRSVETALSGCERATSLIEQLLGFSRQGKYNLKTVSLQHSVDETLEFLSRVVGSDIEIVRNGAEKRHFVHADRGQLQQALTNLILNAQQAMPEGGSITFEFTSEHIENPTRHNPRAVPGEYAVLTVRDSGVGIDAAHLHKVFEPFFTTKQDSKGTGLGLAMVYGMMQNHGGWVEVESTAGAGTQFRLYFPRVEDTTRIDATDGVDRSQPVSSGTVMVVDDEQTLVDLARQFLSLAGFSTEGFTDATEAIHWYERNWSAVDLIVLDMKMPRMDGRSAFTALRRINPDARIVLLSGFIHDAAAQQLLEQGALKFFQKPLRYPELVEWIAATLGSQTAVPVQ